MTKSCRHDSPGGRVVGALRRLARQDIRILEGVDIAKRCIVKPGSKVKLADWNPGDDFGIERNDALLAEATERLGKLQQLLYADNRHALLIVLQALDAGGKDGTISHVMSGVNPQGCQVTSFKAPTGEEREHDFLWRIHNAAPRLGQIGIFNRSHYEDVLVVRVHDLVPKKVWSKRYRQINEFERSIAANNTTILKFFLHISKDEQKKRFEARISDPAKNWKLNPTDFEERKHWDEYTAAYEAALRKCSTDWAPWYVIPSDDKWIRNYVISRIIVKALEELHLKFPPPPMDLSKIDLS